MLDGATGLAGPGNCGEEADEIRTGNGPDEQAILEDRKESDAVQGHQAGGFGGGGGRIDGDDAATHDVTYGAAAFPDDVVFADDAGERAVRSDDG